MGFAPEWLALREEADARARNRDVAETMSARFALRDAISVIDLGSGTGANLRATASLLPSKQNWTLVDIDAALLEKAAQALSSWADTATRLNDGRLQIAKDRMSIEVQFVRSDLSRDVGAIIEGGADLVTASALFDLVSVPFLRTLAHAIAARRASFYSVLTYNGVHRWTPRRPDDNRVSSAFHRHQLRDKGFGPALGPVAGVHLAEQFSLEGYSVIEGESIWRLTRNDRQLLEELVRGHAIAAADTGLVDCKTIEAWVKVPRTGADVGHTDIFAAPA